MIPRYALTRGASFSSKCELHKRVSTTDCLDSVKNHGINPEEIFQAGGKVMSIPMEEKLAYEHEGGKGSSFGYAFLPRHVTC